MKQEELDKIIADHECWVEGKGGRRADLHGVDLSDMHVRGVLRGADLRGARLRGADLYEACLCEADLCNADLDLANLFGACLRGANLRKASLCQANLSYAKLDEANLVGTNLWETNLQQAGLAGTVLDPNNVPNGDVRGFERTQEGRVVGYRSREAGHIYGGYRDGRYYSADVFSTCDETECHPGLYIWPTLHLARKSLTVPGEIIRVETEPKEVHHVGNKWRCRWFYVIGKVEL